MLSKVSCSCTIWEPSFNSTHLAQIYLPGLSLCQNLSCVCVLEIQRWKDRILSSPILPWMSEIDDYNGMMESAPCFHVRTALSTKHREGTKERISLGHQKELWTEVNSWTECYKRNENKPGGYKVGESVQNWENSLQQRVPRDLRKFKPEEAADALERSSSEARDCGRKARSHRAWCAM